MTEEKRVAVNVAVPPKDAVPAALESSVGAEVTKRSPVPLLAVKLPVAAKLATMPLASVPAPAVVATPVRVAMPLLSVVAVPTLVPSRVKVTV